MQVLSRRVAASAFISKHAGARPWAQGSGPATSPSPSPSPSMQQLPPTDKQLAFAETLAEQHNVELPAEVCWPCACESTGAAASRAPDPSVFLAPRSCPVAPRPARSSKSTLARRRSRRGSSCCRAPTWLGCTGWASTPTCCATGRSARALSSGCCCGSRPRRTLRTTRRMKHTGARTQRRRWASLRKRYSGRARCDHAMMMREKRVCVVCTVHCRHCVLWGPAAPETRTLSEVIHGL